MLRQKREKRRNYDLNLNSIKVVELITWNFGE